MQWQDIDFDDRSILVQRGFVRGQLEDTTKNGKDRRVDMSELRRVLNSLNSLVEDTAVDKSPPEQPFDAGAVTPILITLVQQCEENDTSALETIESNAVLFSTDSLKSELTLLIKALEAYDFETALVSLERIKTAILHEE